MLVSKCQLRSGQHSSWSPAQGEGLFRTYGRCLEKRKTTQPGTRVSDIMPELMSNIAWHLLAGLIVNDDGGFAAGTNTLLFFLEKHNKASTSCHDY